MQPHVLELELEALSRLGPELQGLAATLKQEQPTATTDPASDTPTMVAARSISALTVAAVRNAVADRFNKVADQVDRARSRFTHSDTERAAMVIG